MVSLTVVSITNTLDLDKNEIKSMNLLLRLEERKLLRFNAGKFLTSVAYLKLQKRKNRDLSPSLIKEYKIKIKQYRNKFIENIRYLNIIS